MRRTSTTAARQRRWRRAGQSPWPDEQLERRSSQPRRGRVNDHGREQPLGQSHVKTPECDTHEQSWNVAGKREDQVRHDQHYQPGQQNETAV